MKLFHDLKKDTLLLTPNRRLSAYYSKQYERYQLAQHKQCWATLDILPFTSWLERAWKIYINKYIVNSRILLKPHQELILWEEIINQAEDSKHLLQKSDTAEIAKSAWSTLKQWSVNLDDPQLKTTEDSHTFYNWALSFQKVCNENGWIDQSSLLDLIIENINTKNIPSPINIILIGFTDISPIYHKLLNAFEKNGTHIKHYLQKPRNNSIKKISLTDKETEIRTMARWAKNIYSQSQEHEVDNNKIACIIPNLEDHRDTVNRIFTEIFTDAYHYTTESLSLPFNISAGKTLVSYPVIHTAFQLLQMGKNKITIETLSNILRSPFIGDAENEMLARANFDIQLRKDNVTELTLTQLLNLNHTPDLFTKRLQHYFEHLELLPAKQSVNYWVKHIIELLTVLGWPGERSVNSEEYQVIQSWVKLLSEYQSYEHILSEINYTTALHYLKRIAASTVFQPESPETPIQILGMLEAAEIPFQYLWSMGMDDNNWPPSPKPNPFIPQQLQKKLSMPHATAERELRFCQKMTTQLKNSADYIVFSHALHDEESEVRASALLEDIPFSTIDEINLAQHQQPTEIIYLSKDIEQVIDNKATEILDVNSIYGGAKIFELQAACPFKAFAQLRLHANPIAETSHGLRPLDRGNIVHKALEYIWGNLGDSSNLHAQSLEELNNLITLSIKKAIRSITGQETTNLNYLRLELQRLEKIILKWLEIEKTRPAFKVISQEQKYLLTIANIPISLRVDRIDECENNKIIIDYKTGKHNPIHAWFGERLDAPQLPIYCLLDPDHTVAIAFASINSEKMELKGISKHDLKINSIQSIADVKFTETNLWSEQVNIWRNTLEQLGNDFYQGVANVDPKDGMTTCEHCKLKSFCRVYEKENI